MPKIDLSNIRGGLERVWNEFVRNLTRREQDDAKVEFEKIVTSIDPKRPLESFRAAMELLFQKYALMDRTALGKFYSIANQYINQPKTTQARGDRAADVYERLAAELKIPGLEDVNVPTEREDLKTAMRPFEYKVLDYITSAHTDPGADQRAHDIWLVLRSFFYKHTEPAKLPIIWELPEMPPLPKVSKIPMPPKPAKITALSGTIAVITPPTLGSCAVAIMEMSNGEVYDLEVCPKGMIWNPNTCVCE